MNEFGVVTHPDTVRIERLLPGPIERVWDYLTDSKKRGTWLATGKMELRVGGKVELEFHHADLSAEKIAPEKFRKNEGHVMSGQITACEPPRLLSYTFGDAGEVTFELTPKRKGCAAGADASPSRRPQDDGRRLDRLAQPPRHPHRCAQRR